MTYKRIYQRKVYSFYLEPEIVTMLDAECKRTGENRSEFMRRIIMETLNHQETENEYAINEPAG